MSKYKESISVFFPAYNEEGNIGNAIESALHVLPRLTDKWEIIVVNDGSKDRTGKIAEKYMVEYPGVSVIHHPINRGYGGALQTGFRAAKCDLIFFSDSDLQFDINEMKNLLEWIDEYDVVIGYRKNRKDSSHRRFNAYCWNLLIRMLLGVKVKDIDCAFKMFRRTAIEDMNVSATGAMVSAEVMAQVVRKGVRIKEVPVTHYPRVFGEQTGANLSVVLRAFRELIKLYKNLKEKRKHPRVDLAMKFKLRDNSSRWTEGAVNVASGGIRFLIDRSYRLDEPVGMDIAHDSTVFTVKGIVKRVRAVDGKHEVVLRVPRLKRDSRRALRNLVAYHWRTPSRSVPNQGVTTT